VEWCDAWGEYRDALERLLHAFKFERHDFLADRFADLLTETITDVAFDTIAAVPMHPSKRRRRGYNQSELLAEALSKRMRIPFDAKLLRKRFERGTQSTLPRAARSANVRDVFEASSNAEEKSVLLVDDICTTGETFRAAGRELLRAGASRVCAIAVAKAT
jgi:ComF family protein